MRINRKNAKWLLPGFLFLYLVFNLLKAGLYELGDGVPTASETARRALFAPDHRTPRE